MSEMASLTASATPGSMHMSLDGLRKGKGTDSVSLSRKSGIKTPRNRPLPKSFSQHAEPSTAASIPSRYQTFFYATTENKGFNTQASRFTRGIDISDIPGPGSYKTQQETLENMSVSFSKRGTGGFASKSKRFRRAMQQKLGPGSYNPQVHTFKTDFNKAGVGSNFQQPIAVKAVEGKEKFSSPAPNSYNLAGMHTGKNSLVTAEAAFKSRTKRELLQMANNPAPGQYNVQDKLLHRSTCPHKSVFNSKSQREMFPKSALGPGPADYSPFDGSESSGPKALPYYHQKHYLCISAPAMPLPPLPPSPGPGHYETQEQMTTATNDEKRLVSGAVFKSTTSRWMSAHTLNNTTTPGPCYYDPVFPKKRSYLYNVERKWI